MTFEKWAAAINITPDNNPDAYAVSRMGWLASRKAALEEAAEMCGDISASYYPHAKGPYLDCMDAILALANQPEKGAGE